jgi:hypothetical protein
MKAENKHIYLMCLFPGRLLQGTNCIYCITVENIKRQLEISIIWNATQSIDTLSSLLQFIYLKLQGKKIQ